LRDQRFEGASRVRSSRRWSRRSHQILPSR
jgi:hypothetical protein